MKYVVVVGSPFEGMSLYGPFDNLSDAQDYYEAMGFADDDEWDADIITVLPPEDPDHLYA